MTTVPIEQYKERAAHTLQIIQASYGGFIHENNFERHCSDLRHRFEEEQKEPTLIEDILDWVERARNCILESIEECANVQACNDRDEAARLMNVIYLDLQTAAFDLSCARHYDAEPTVP